MMTVDKCPELAIVQASRFGTRRKRNEGRRPRLEWHRGGDRWATKSRNWFGVRDRSGGGEVWAQGFEPLNKGNKLAKKVERNVEPWHYLPHEARRQTVCDKRIWGKVLEERLKKNNSGYLTSPHERKGAKPTTWEEGRAAPHGERRARSPPR